VPRPNFPRVAPFEVGPLEFRDLRTVSGIASARASAAFYRALVTDWEDGMPPERERTGLCDADQERASRALDRYEGLNARRAERGARALTWDEFEQRGGTVEHDGDPDPRLPLVRLAVRRSGRWVGIVSILNIRRESDPGVNPIQVSAYGVVGVLPARGENRFRLWGRIYRRLLLTDLSLANGRVLDLVEWRFPTESRRHRFRPRSWNGLGEVFAELRGDGSDVEETRTIEDPEAPARIRRRLLVASSGAN